ncbi:hypothetical protein RSP795_19670 [Ralstonia solanacearum]|uniref:hypothetical protein n=1 Tax=Ralstonia solanacearum TaxID=305 RepID=UPI0007D8595F|nr:hypothetical protein [Ralstonia solanacearum]OAI59698.1 hypothetical protein RSP795_19670 [Ralstonia solanacearum]
MSTIVMVSTIDQKRGLNQSTLAQKIDSSESAHLPPKPRAVRANIDLHSVRFLKTRFLMEE